MRCWKCGAKNTETTRFCGGCGAQLLAQCPSCSTLARVGTPFCHSCRAALLAAGPTTILPERRQLTVMFCDLVDSTALSQRIDPEDLTHLIHKYYDHCATIVHRHDGFLAQYLGDGVLVYFGYPVAREDDAQRAIRAGLEMVAKLPSLNLPAGLPEGIRLRSRIGIHSGVVVVGDLEYAGQQRLRTITGETPNIAARLQQLAESDTIAISGATRRLVEGLFILRDLGAQTLKGTSSSIRVYQVIDQTAAESKFEVAVQTGLLPLVGREPELKAIFNQWEATKAGLGRLFLLEGEVVSACWWKK